MAEPALQEPASDVVAWKTDSRGREYVGARGRSGQVYRQGEETIEEAWARDAEGPKKRTPKKRARKPPAPTQVSMQELEFALTEALKSPGMMLAMNGDEWGSQHFTNQAPIVARNLVMCAQHNPWLHEKLLALMSGESAMMNVMVFMALGSAMFAYIVPPIVYYFNPPFMPERGRELIREKYAIPERLEEPVAPAETATFPAQAAAAAA